MSVWTLSSSYDDPYEDMRSEAYDRYRSVQREPSIPKECQICYERIKPGEEIIARLDGRNWSAKHRSCDEKLHSASMISPVQKPKMVDREIQVNRDGDVKSPLFSAAVEEPELFTDIPDVVQKPSPMRKIAHGLWEVTSGLWDIVRNNPRSVLLGGLAIATVMAYRAYSGQEYQLYCVKDRIDEQVAYCAKISADPSAEQRAAAIYTKHLMEGQYYPAPDHQESSYAEIAGGEEFSSLSWTS